MHHTQNANRLYLGNSLRSEIYCTSRGTWESLGICGLPPKLSWLGWETTVTHLREHRTCTETPRRKAWRERGHRSSLSERTAGSSWDVTYQGVTYPKMPKGRGHATHGRWTSRTWKQAVMDTIPGFPEQTDGKHAKYRTGGDSQYFNGINPENSED